MDGSNEAVVAANTATFELILSTPSLDHIRELSFSIQMPDLDQTMPYLFNRRLQVFLKRVPQLESLL